MKFKRHFRIFALAWVLAVMTVSDILLISAFRGIVLDTDRKAPYPAMILVPAGFAAAGRLLAGLFPLLLIRRLRRSYLALEGVTEYTFFRNFALTLAVGAAANTVLLYVRYRSVMELLIKDEERRLHLLFSSEPERLEGYLAALTDRVSSCNTVAVIMTVLLIIGKAAAYLFMARGLVKSYHKHARTGYAPPSEI